MARPKSDSKQRLIEAAIRLFSQQGYQATGLSQIVKESGAPRGSIYFLFPGGKEELAIEAFKQSSLRIRHLLMESAKHSHTIEEWLRNITNHMAQALVSSDYRTGSPFAGVILDAVNNQSLTLDQICHKAYEEWIEQVATILHHRFDVDQQQARELATFSIGAIEGALILCRAKRSTESLTMITEQLVGWIDSQLK